jgi:hypothetical protein
MEQLASFERKLDAVLSPNEISVIALRKNECKCGWLSDHVPSSEYNGKNVSHGVFTLISCVGSRKRFSSSPPFLSTLSCFTKIFVC